MSLLSSEMHIIQSFLTFLPSSTLHATHGSPFLSSDGFFLLKMQSNAQQPFARECEPSHSIVQWTRKSDSRLGCMRSRVCTYWTNAKVTASVAHFFPSLKLRTFSQPKSPAKATSTHHVIHLKETLFLSFFSVTINSRPPSESIFSISFLFSSLGLSVSQWRYFLTFDTQAHKVHHTKLTINCYIVPIHLTRKMGDVTADNSSQFDLNDDDYDYLIKDEGIMNTCKVI